MLARRAEELGYDSLWASDHVVIPTQIASTYPYSADGASPFDPEQAYTEPLTTLSYMAGYTQRIRLGTWVLIVPYRNPILVAKMVANMDYLSGGRIILGVGVGWMEEEFKALGLDTFSERGAATDEYIRIYKALWTEDTPSFSGRFCSFPSITAVPKPVQKPHPPIWVGGHTAPALRRAATLGDAWLPFGQQPHAELGPAELSEKIARLRDLTVEAGRPADAVSVTFSVPLDIRDTGASDGARALFTGTPQQVAEDVLAYREAGVSHFIFILSRESIQHAVGAMERFATEVKPLVAAR